MQEQFTKQVGISYAIGRHPRREHVDEAFYKEIEKKSK